MADQYRTWKADPNPERLHGLIGQLGRTIDGAVQAHAGSFDSPVVRQRARLMAADAIQSYDPTRGASLATHVSNSLRALSRVAPTITDPFPAPERFRVDSGRIGGAIKVFRDESGRDPSDEELGELVGLAPARVAKVRNRMRSRVSASRLDGSEQEDEDQPWDTRASERTDEDDWVDAVYHDLGPIDRQILQHRTGYRGAETLSVGQLAERLGVSPSAITQRARRIQQQLDRFGDR